MSKKKKSGAKPGSRNAAREQLRAARAREAAAAKRRERIWRGGIALAVVVVIVAAVVIIQWQRSRVDTSAAYPSDVAAGYKLADSRRTAIDKADKAIAAAEKATKAKNPAGDAQQKLDDARRERAAMKGLWLGVGVGKANAPVTVEMFEDFSCPHCREFEADQPWDALKSWVDSGKVRVVYYPMTMDEFASQGTDRAANAFACAAQEGKAEQYHAILYANQQSWNDSVLTQLGRQVGLDSGAFRSCVRSDRYEGWLDSIDQTATDRGVTGTPTVMINGKPLDTQDTTVMTLRLEVDDAVAKLSKGSKQ